MIYGIEKPEPGDCAVTIALWSIKEIICCDNMEPSHHLIGFVPQDSLGRVSSAIQSFDKEKLIIETSSGRLYKLHGRPGCHPDADYVWRRWKNFNNARNERDVTEYYWESET